MSEDIRNGGHWDREDYEQRMTRKDWQKLLLDKDDSVIFRGRLRKLVAKNLGAGVYAVRKTPKKET